MGTPLWLSRIVINRFLLIEVAVICNCILLYLNVKVIASESRVARCSMQRVATLIYVLSQVGSCKY